MRAQSMIMNDSYSDYCGLATLDKNICSVVIFELHIPQHLRAALWFIHPQYVSAYILKSTQIYNGNIHKSQIS